MPITDLSELVAASETDPAMATDAEVAAAIADHEAKTDPHPVYLTQAEGDSRYRQSATALVDADIPAAIARDAEVAAAISAHAGASDPHPVYLTQVEADGSYRKTSEQQVFTGAVKSVAKSEGAISDLTKTNQCGFEIQSLDSSSAAYQSFHRPGLYAVQVGLDTDNQFKIGGWSMGNTAYKFWHEGNSNIQNPPASVYGSIGIAGNKNGYAGINFSNAFDTPVFMVHTGANLHGMWSPNSAFGWHWLYNAGRVTIYNSEYIASGDQRGTYIALDKSKGSLPGWNFYDFPVIKTDAPAIYFSARGKYSAAIDENGVYSSASDKNRKENSQEVNYAAILQKLNKIPIYRYNFKGESDRIKRCGCYAQDFYEAFSLGGDKEIDGDDSPTTPSKMIAATDAIGILMAAVKGLALELESLKKKLQNS